MSFFLMIILSIVLGDLAWWLWSDRRLRRTRRPLLWRSLLGVFNGVMLGFVLWIVLFPYEGRHAHLWVPMPILSAIYVWHLLVLPVVIVLIAAAYLLQLPARVARLFRRRQTTAEDALKQQILKTATAPASAAGRTISRRQALAAVAVATPPLIVGGLVVRSLAQVQQFRINRIELPLAKLPPELDGLTIAQVSDVHVGRFTRGPMLRKIAEATNGLKADLVLLTGDLIDLTLSDLPAAIDFVRRLDPRQGLFTCEGNHDLIENRIEFERRTRASGVPLLLDESAVVTINGRRVQVLGMSWGRNESAFVGSMSRLLPRLQDQAFPILLAHHPHAFDTAAAVGIPLTLAGHTHGGQLMLNERLGAGPAMFRYWSGVYRKADAALCVSNGVGNWFPVRTHAPAEIVHLTLRRAPAPPDA